MSETIKPCPFCFPGGNLGKNHVPRIYTSRADYWVECPVCMSQGPSGETREEAVQAWNNRPHERTP